MGPVQSIISGFTVPSPNMAELDTLSNLEQLERQYRGVQLSAKVNSQRELKVERLIYEKPRNNFARRGKGADKKLVFNARIPKLAKTDLKTFISRNRREIIELDKALVGPGTGRVPGNYKSIFLPLPLCSEEQARQLENHAIDLSHFVLFQYSRLLQSSKIGPYLLDLGTFNLDTISPLELSIVYPVDLDYINAKHLTKATKIALVAKFGKVSYHIHTYEYDTKFKQRYKHSPSSVTTY